MNAEIIRLAVMAIAAIGLFALLAGVVLFIARLIASEGEYNPPGDA